MSTLRISYEPEDAGHGQLTAQAQSGSFAGHGSAWFNRSDLLEFASRLASYPIPRGPAVILQGGYWGKAASDGLTQTHLRMAFEPYDRTGRIRVNIILADPYEDTQADELAQSANLFFLTTYNEICAFREAFLEVINGESGVAQLQGGDE